MTNTIPPKRVACIPVSRVLYRSSLRTESTYIYASVYTTFNACTLEDQFCLLAELSDNTCSKVLRALLLLHMNWMYSRHELFGLRKAVLVNICDDNGLSPCRAGS